MVDKDERKAQAAKHIALMNAICASNTEATVAAATIYEDGDGRALTLPDAPFETTKTLTTSAFAPEAMRRFATGKTCVVDPASFMRPGGSYEDGSFGPEQIICSESNLYQVLRGIKRTFHDQNRDYRCGQLFTDRAAYLPNVVFPGDDGEMRTADIIAIAEPLRARAIENHRSERECDLALANRIDTLLTIAAAHEIETLVVGAFGGGRLGYDTSRIVEAFRTWIDAHPGAIGQVVFAVPRFALDAFEAAFGSAPRAERAQAAAPAPREDAEDEVDLSSIELPEGVTLRR